MEIGDKVIITNYSFYSEYEGKIGKIIEIRDTIYIVEMEDGLHIKPYKETYTRPQCKPFKEETMKYDNCVIEVLDREHGAKVIQWWKDQGVDTKKLEVYNTKANEDDYRFYGLLNGNFTYNNEDYFLSVGCKIITLPEELPEKWCITATLENNEYIKTYWKSLGKSMNNDWNIGNHYCYQNGSLQGWMYYAPERKDGFTEITTDQFKTLVLKQNNMTYQLKEEFKHLEDAARTISGITSTMVPLNGLLKDSLGYERLEKAGVLHWFEEIPQYKKGDKVTDDNGKNVYTYTYSDGDRHHVEESKTSLGDRHRLATPGEIETFNKRKEITILGYTAEKTTGGVKFGCQEFDKNTLNVLKDLKSRTEAGFQISINYSKKTHNITLKQIEQLLSL